MQLFIDSTTNTHLILKLDHEKKSIEYDSPRDQDTLLAIHQFLTEQGVKASQLTSINIHTGPGNFTSIRTSIAVVQALALALNIPINGKPAGTSIHAIYGKEPSITLPNPPIAIPIKNV